MAAQMSQLLAAATGGDMNARVQAQSVLENAEKTQTLSYINALVELIVNVQAPEDLRNLVSIAYTAPPF
jgi:hypothetical protein